MGCASKGVPIVFQVIACLFLIAAIILTVVSITTYSWQNFTTEDNVIREIHHHGLWQDCIEEFNKISRTKSKTCFFKFHSEDSSGHSHAGHNHPPGSEFNEEPGEKHVHQHKILSLPSRQTVLIFLSVAAILGLIGLLFSFCAPFMAWTAVVWSVLCFISTICSIIGIIVFFVNSHDFEKSYTSSSTTTHQSHGSSFYCGLVGIILFLVATILSALATVLYFTMGRRNEDDYVGKNVNKTWPKLQYNHNTAV